MPKIDAFCKPFAHESIEKHALCPRASIAAIVPQMGDGMLFPTRILIPAVCLAGLRMNSLTAFFEISRLSW